MTEKDQPAAPKRRWDLNREALDALLSAFHADRAEAARQYEELRGRLIDLFAWEACSVPDQLADEALNRLARKVAEGVPIPRIDRFAFGIARFLVQEDTRERHARLAALRELPAHVRTRSTRALAALEHCLAVLPEPSRRLIERYYAEDRAGLARELGITLNALRNRAMRIREDLCDCVSRRCDDE